MTKKDMSIKTFDYLYRSNANRKGNLKNPPTVTAQFQVRHMKRMEPVYRLTSNLPSCAHKSFHIYLLSNGYNIRGRSVWDLQGEPL